MEKTTEYRTKDIFEASFLHCSQIKILRLEPTSDSAYYWFIFQDDKDHCQKLTNAYWNKSAMVDAKTFADSCRTIKDFMFRKRRGIAIGDGL